MSAPTPSAQSSYDVLVVGAGAAGLSAALWSADLALRCCVLESEPEAGGQLRFVHNPILNYPGLDLPNGHAFRDGLLAQLASKPVELRLGQRVVEVDLERLTVSTASGLLRARALVLATGTRRRRLGVPGESELEGRGIIDSGRRAPERLAGHSICIIGGGDAAVENALLLASVCRSVVLVHRGQRLRARHDFAERALRDSRIHVVSGATVLRVLGEQRVEGVELSRHGAAELVPAEAVLIRIGVDPASDLVASQCELDGRGYVKVSGTGETSARGVFAIGDVACPTAPTLAGAAGSAATAMKTLALQLARATSSTTA